MKEQCSVDTVVEIATVGPFSVNTFFLHARGSDEVIVIDPGDEPDRLLGLVAAKGWKPVAILNTHGHLDHMGAIQPLKERFEIPLFLHGGDLEILRNAPEHAQYFGLPSPPATEVDTVLEHGQVLELAGLRLQVLHTPGHTPGGVGFLVGERVFAGDTLFAGSIGRTDLPGGDLQTLLCSIRDQLLTLPDETRVHCGHGPDTSIGVERRSNPYLQGDGFSPA